MKTTDHESEEGSRIYPRATVAKWIAIIIVATLALTYLISSLPSIDDSCAEHCSALGKKGRIDYVSRWDQLPGVRTWGRGLHQVPLSKGPQQCICE